MPSDGVYVVAAFSSAKSLQTRRPRCANSPAKGVCGLPTTALPGSTIKPRENLEAIGANATVMQMLHTNLAYKL